MRALAASGLVSGSWPALAACSNPTETADVDGKRLSATPTPAPTTEPLVVGGASSWFLQPPVGLAQTADDGRWYSLVDGMLTRRQRLAVPSVDRWAWTWEVTDSADVRWDYEQLVALGHGVLIGRRANGALHWHRDLSIGRNPMRWSINDGRQIAEGWRLAHLLALHSGHILAVDPDGATWWHQWLGDSWHPGSGSVQVANDWIFDAASAAGATVYGATGDEVQVRAVVVESFVAPDLAPQIEVAGPLTLPIRASAGLIATGDSSFLVAPGEATGSWRHVQSGEGLGWGAAPAVDMTPVESLGPASAVHALGGPVTLEYLGPATGQPSTPVDAYWQNQTVTSGQMPELAISTPVDGTELRLDFWDVTTSASVVSMALTAGNQGVPALAWNQGCDWQAIEIPIPPDLVSGLYTAVISMADAPPATAQSELPVDGLFVPLIVRPAPIENAPMAVLANTNTWNAYNSWGGIGQYTNPFGARLSFRRPNRSLDPGRLLGLADGDDLAAPAHHLVAGEARLLTWMRAQGYDFHLWSDSDLHDGALDLDRYQTLVIHSHPEYWTGEMFDTVSRWLGGGGKLVNLGANGLYERVELVFDTEGQPTSMVLRGGDPEGERDLMRFSGRRERSLLGVAFEGELHPDDPPRLQKGNAQGRYAPYRVVDAGHRFFADTGLRNGDEFVTVDGVLGGAGWELDTSFFDGHVVSGGPAPDNLELLARGVLGERPEEQGLWTEDHNAHMTYYDHPGGGWVFSAGSLVFTHWMVEDFAAQQLVRNVLDEAAGA